VNDVILILKCITLSNRLYSTFKNPMKKILIVTVALLVILWAVMFFVLKTGDIAYIMLVIAGVIFLLLYSLRRVIT